jgi:hypothetical protein
MVIRYDAAVGGGKAVVGQGLVPANTWRAFQRASATVLARQGAVADTPPTVIEFPTFRRCRQARRWIALPFGLAVLGCAPAAPETPMEAAKRWYAVLDSLGVHTVPEPAALELLRPYMTDTLVQLMQRAHAVRDSVRGLVPREKPPFVDGELFASLFEGYTETHAQATRVVGDTALVIMAFTNDTQTPTVRWTDTVVVVRERGGYVVADLRYGAAWEFATHGRLRTVLTFP